MGKRKAKQEAFTDDDDALLAELGVETEVKQDQTYTARQERIIAGFEDIQRFYREHDRLPCHGEDRDIFERLYAVRLDCFKVQAKQVKVITGPALGNFFRHISFRVAICGRANVLHFGNVVVGMANAKRL